MSEIQNISSDLLAEWINQDQVFLVDVREPFEHQDVAIENSINIPLAEISLNDFASVDFENKKVVIYCRSGKRSYTACEKLKKDGASFEAINLEGGIISWSQHNLPTK